jgi:RHH-type transcriptional regulator, proline utilization regulon repressor / proline dehydrogenase / delta 1-pyrroline-5-carboxylate dehydrogenase
VAGVVFTGSTATAKRIDRAMATHLDPFAPLVAETGGLNAMVVDSTALPEQAVRDIVASAFRSAGQRCSALRCLYVQEDVADRVLTMLEGAMRELALGDPWDAATDVGPIITTAARDDIAAHVEAARREGRLVAAMGAPGQGAFLGPAILRVSGIADLRREVFGPVLHVATFRAADLDRVTDAINATGYGLTFGLHTRIDDRVERLSSRLRVGNIYVNRNQIGAVVGSQPFGGEGLSGTGPKAGGPAYVARFRAGSDAAVAAEDGTADAGAARRALAAAAFDPFATLSSEVLPGPTGELNRLTTHPRGPVLCLGPGTEAARAQAMAARAAGCPAVEAPGLDAGALRDLPGLAVAAFDGSGARARDLRRALAEREGPIVPLARLGDLPAFCRVERHLCIDTTASGGNATLLAASA